MQTVTSMLIGMLSSLTAAFVYAGIVLCRAAHVRKARARPFEGVYDMLDPSTEQPRGGTVTVKYKPHFWDTTPILTAHAKHSTGEEDWVGTLEVRGLSDIATGFYQHPNRRGGALQFTLVGDSEIMEQGNPHDPRYEKFEKLLRRTTPLEDQEMNQGLLSDADAEKLVKVIATGYEKANSYSRVIVGLGYAALLTVWSGTRQLMTERHLLASALLILVSLLAYVVFEICQMLFNSWASWRFSKDVAEKGVPFALSENAKTIIKWQPRIYLTWWVTFLIALPTGLTAAGILVESFLCRLLP
jgi:hypothetical protein